MTDTPPRVDFGRQIGLLSRRWRARIDERLRFTGLTQSRWHALLELSKTPDGLTQRELAERVGIEGPTLVRQLDDLQAQGLIERSPVEGDRRANNVRLTPAAEPLIRKLTSIVEEMRTEILGGISEAELAVVVDVLRRVNSKVEEL
jgi:MarR family transcriptional regulator, transcriptional regulator for hemolysin